jgi:hypothetical protein
MGRYDYCACVQTLEKVCDLARIMTNFSPAVTSRLLAGNI